MTLNGVTDVTLRYFTEIGKPAFQQITASICGGYVCTSLLYFVVRVRCRRYESSRSLSHLLMSFLYFTALHGIPARTSYKKAVCPSVWPSVKRVDCDKRKKDLSRFLYHTKDHLSVVFWEWLVGRPLLQTAVKQYWISARNEKCHDTTLSFVVELS